MPYRTRTRPRARRPDQRPITVPRLVLFPDAPSADGTPRAGILHPGSRLPVIFPNLPAALAALSNAEAR